MFPEHFCIQLIAYLPDEARAVNAQARLCVGSYTCLLHSRPDPRKGPHPSPRVGRVAERSARAA
jgi:hypothetical protein